MLTTGYRFGEVHNLASQIENGSEKIHFRHIFENSNGAVSLLALQAGQALSEHTAPAEVMVNVLAGEVEFNLTDRRIELKTGDFMLLGEGVPHSVAAKTDAKIMLVKIKADR